MQDLLKKIIEMDEQARKTERQAKSEKLASELEIEQLRETIYNDYIQRAKKRVEKNIAVDKANADKKLEEYSRHAEALSEDMKALYAEKKESWISEIVSRVLS